ncbi:MAG: flagellar biosynthetic protein FliP [Myxococcaceae bacterium]|nr:flagellar biosynthetic protein FliP [Myxococcaceae bacterium]
MRLFRSAGLSVLGWLVLADVALAQQTPSISVTLGGGTGPEQLVPSLKVLALLTVLTLAPAVLISMTSFTRIVVVLSFVRQAVGTQNVPPTQVMLSLALLLTFVVMAPVGARVNEVAIVPYSEKRIDEAAAWDAARVPISQFLLAQTREDDLKLFYDLTHAKLPSSPSDVSIHLLVPAFMISELRTGFEMGFLLFLPFALIDLVVASLLTAMGMMMLPPTTLSTPLKLLLFVAVDGWALLTRSLVASFS